MKLNKKKFLFFSIVTFLILSGCGGGSIDSKTETPPLSMDTTPPVITLNGDVQMTLTTGDTYVEQGATATDKKDGDITSSIQIKSNVNTSIVGKYEIIYTVKDRAGNSASTKRIVIVLDAVEEMIKSGDIKKTHALDIDLIDAVLKEIEELKRGDKLFGAVYEDDSISYAPGKYYSQITNIIENSDKRKQFPILMANKGNPLAVAGYKEKGRFAFFGSHPMRYFQNDENLEYEPYMKKIISWLIKGLPIDANVDDKNITVALMFPDYKSDTANWLTKHYPKWRQKTCDDIDTTESCAEDADLIITGQGKSKESEAKTVTTFFDTWFKSGKGVLYMHPNWGKNDYSSGIASYFNISLPYGGNWWAEDSASWDSVDRMIEKIATKEKYDLLQTLFMHFKNRDFSFDWSKCKNADGSSYSGCTAVPNLKTDFQDAADKIKSMIDNFDKKNKNIFISHNTDYKLQKLMVLIADKFRQTIKYPMDKISTDDTEFMRSYYADHVVYNSRKLNYVQPDMGNFSRSDFSGVETIDKTISFVSKEPFRSASVYALPGQTFTVTRLDNDYTKVKVFINTLRDSATHQYSTNGYKRPKFTQSVHIALKKDKPVTLTSPYGGPIELQFDDNDRNVTVKFEHVAQHPVWSEFDTNPNKDSDFQTALDSDQFDWAEIVTSAFEVHSKRDKMLKSIQNFRWKNASALASATKTYASSYPMALAGYKGPGIAVIDDIVNFAKDHEIPIYNSDFVKHMNADQAACGYGCSGNPYDAFWAFDPISHGDIHEIGHSLEKWHMRLKGWETHASTNWYAYYSQSRYNKYVESNNEITDKAKYYITNSHVPVSVFRNTFNHLKQATREDNVTEYMQENFWKDSNYSPQSLFMIEAMMLAQKYAIGKYSFADGYHLLGRLHLLERDLEKSGSNLEAEKEKLGFSTYATDELKKIGSNDWLVISLSYATGLDFRPFFDMYGEPYSTKASEQIDSFAFPEAPKVFFIEKTDSGFISPDDGSGAYLDREELKIDSSQEYYPYN